MDALYLLPYNKRAMASVFEKNLTKFSAIPDEAKRADYNSNDHVGTVTALRSMGNWSGGLANTEHSICDAYCSLIKNSKSHIYMENQFFCTTVSTGESTRGNMDVENRIGEEICNRIIKAHENGEDFKMYCVIPIGLRGEDTRTFLLKKRYEIFMIF